MIDFQYPEGATPLDWDEAQGLRLTHITTRGELDQQDYGPLLAFART